MYGLTLIAAVALAAQASGGNLIENSDFESGIGGWDYSGNCFQPGFDSSVGSPSDGALALNCFGGSDLFESAAQCVVLTSPVALDFSARWTENGSLPGVGSAGFAVEVFDVADCAGAALAAHAPDMTTEVAGSTCCGGDWHEVAFVGRTLPESARSVRVSLSAASRCRPGVRPRPAGHEPRVRGWLRSGRSRRRKQEPSRLGGPARRYTDRRKAAPWRPRGGAKTRQTTFIAPDERYRAQVSRVLNVFCNCSEPEEVRRDLRVRSPASGLACAVIEGERLVNVRVAIVAAGLSVFGTASATTFCVASSEDLTASLLAAQNDASSDQILLRAGHYPAPDGGWHVDIQNKGITITGGFQDAGCETLSLDASATVLDGHGEVRPLTIDTSFHDIEQKDGQILISGLTIENGFGDRVGGLKVSDAGPIYNGTIRIERNIFRNNTAASYQQDNSAGALLAATDGAGFGNGLTYLIVRNNLFVGNRAKDAAAAMLYSDNTIAVNNNTFAGNQATDETLPVRTAIAWFTFSGAYFDNNVFWNNNPDNLAGTYDLRADSASVGVPHASLFNSDLQALFGTPAEQDANTSADPRFADAPGGNFRLAADSPLIDAGLDAPATGGIGAIDLDGLARLRGQHVDMGAYETMPDPVFADGFDAG